MKKSVLAFLLVLVSAIAQAQAPANYYSTANGLTGDDLKAALHNIIKNHHVVSYNGLLDAFPYTDCDTDGKIIDIYSNNRYSTGNVCGNYSGEGDCWNREHTWPQSWFKEKSGPKSDLFHVYPTDGYVNNRRSNYPYGEVNNPTYTSGNGSKLGPCVTSGYSGTVFEPIDEYKGDIARGFFYMSVRYAGEDSGWSTSGMTNKSEILPWAMTMLLEWSDNDPVSDKEIARNQAVYGFQHNRNPFIDHPEYARMIWDPNYTPATSYAITCATGLQHGSVSAPSSAMEGTTVDITATPDAGFMVDSYSAYKTGDMSTTVTVSTNGTFTMPSYAVTVSASFVENTQYYTITKGTISHGDININHPSALSGTTINLTAIPDNGYSLYSWYVYKTGDMNTTVEVNNNSFTMPAFNVTVIATFVEGSNGNYVKVTSAPSDWSGDYLIVCESQNVAFNGGLETLDAAGNTIAVTIDNSTITADNTTNAAKFTIAAVSGGYSIKAANGKYIGNASNSNGLTANDSPMANTISLSEGDVNIVGSGGAYLRYNANSGQERFRYFKSSTYSNQQPIQLYKKTSSSSTPTHSINYNSNGGSGTMSTQTVEEMVPTALTNNAFTRDGFVFDGWNTKADGTGDYYLNQAMVSLVSDLYLYAQWDPLYEIIVDTEVQHGSISASAEHAVEGITITLTAIPDEDYELDHWTVTYNNGDNTIDVEENQFEMPAANVTVSATFVYVGNPFVQQYQLVTSTNQLVAGKTYLIVNTSAGKALSKTQNTNNRAAAAVTIVNNVINTIGDACEILLGGSTGAWTLYDATNNSGYLYAASSSYNYLRTQATNDANGEWAISIANNGSATITAQGSNTRKIIRYNSQNNLFSCYASGQQDVYLFVRTDTFVLDIEGYTGNGGWYTIATPFSDFAPAQIATGDYDLYAYNEESDQEWINYKTSPSSFPTSACSGYLYAHNPSTTLQMTGTPNNNNYTETVNLNYDNSDANLKGFNLLGNPTARNITFTTSGDVSDGYYYLWNSDTWLFEPTNSVPIGRGFLVKANAAGQTVTLNPQSRGDRAEATFLCVTIDDEKTYVKLDEGVSMPLLSFQGKSSSVYLTRDGKPYIMLTKDDADAIDVCFKPKRNGEHTLTVSSLISHLSPLTYLHLIDHRTGADIDLIANPSYRFESNSSDYASRFQLRFSDDIDTDSDLFAYYADGRIVVNAEGTLQIHDITGRRVENGHLATGVYVLRLITPEKVRVQKIVID